MQADDDIEVVPARVVRNTLGRTLHWFLPEELRNRFLQIGEDLSYLNAHQWEVRFSFARSRLATGLVDLKGVVHLPSSVELMETWEDDVLFCYVLHFQLIWVRLHSMGDDELVPALFDAFWQWAMVPQLTWIVYTFPTKWQYIHLAEPPMIWQFFAPCDVAMEKE